MSSSIQIASGEFLFDLHNQTSFLLIFFSDDFASENDHPKTAQKLWKSSPASSNKHRGLDFLRYF
jgi:hypothetical protein